MKKTITLALSVLLAFSVTISAAATARTVNRVNTAIPPDSLVRVGTPLPMETDELITIDCIYSPRTADVDFGLITPRNTFVFIKGENGNCRLTIKVNQTGNYYFAVRNSTSGTVEVLGYVYY